MKFLAKKDKKQLKFWIQDLKYSIIMYITVPRKGPSHGFKIVPPQIKHNYLYDSHNPKSFFYSYVSVYTCSYN